MTLAKVIAVLATEKLDLQSEVTTLKRDLEDCKRQRDMLYAQLVLLQEKTL